MSRIDRLIAELCSSGVEFKSLGDVLDHEQPGKYLVSSTAYDDIYRTPVLTAGQTFVLGYTDEREGIYAASPTSPVLIFDDFTTAFKWVDFPFKAKSSAMKMLTPRSDVDVDFKYVFYAMQAVRYEPQEHARQWIGIYSRFKIPIPPISIQQEIVSILDLFMSLDAELMAEIKARSHQYEIYRDLLLINNEAGCEWLTLGDVSTEFGRGKSKHRPRNDPKLYGGSYPFIQTGDIRNSGHVITEYSQTYNEQGLAQSKLWPKGTIGITIAANIAETGILGFDSCFPDSIIGMVVDQEKTSQSFVEYLLQSFKQILEAKGQGSAQTNINLGTFESERFPFPSLKEQERLVGILEKLDAFVNDRTVGLPAELRARRKQFEHYRDRLLTFEDVVT